jgi:hypothetical protein
MDQPFDDAWRSLENTHLRCCAHPRPVELSLCETAQPIQQGKSLGRMYDRRKAQGERRTEKILDYIKLDISYDLTSFKGDMIIEEEFAPVAQLDRAADF